MSLVNDSMPERAYRHLAGGVTSIAAATAAGDSAASAGGQSNLAQILRPERAELRSSAITPMFRLGVILIATGASADPGATFTCALREITAQGHSGNNVVWTLDSEDIGPIVIANPVRDVLQTPAPSDEFELDLTKTYIFNVNVSALTAAGSFVLVQFQVQAR